MMVQLIGWSIFALLVLLFIGLLILIDKDNYKYNYSASRGCDNWPSRRYM